MNDKLNDEIFISLFYATIQSNTILKNIPSFPYVGRNVCFHSHFNSLFYTSHPNIYAFLSNHTEFQTSVYFKINATNLSRKVNNRQQKKNMFLEPVAYRNLVVSLLAINICVIIVFDNYKCAYSK